MRARASASGNSPRLAHDPAAAFGERDQILTQPVDVLLDREATNLAPFSAVTIPELEVMLEDLGKVARSRECVRRCQLSVF
jgi:hypothetical protein